MESPPVWWLRWRTLHDRRSSGSVRLIESMSCLGKPDRTPKSSLSRCRTTVRLWNRPPHSRRVGQQIDENFAMLLGERGGDGFADHGAKLADSTAPKSVTPVEGSRYGL